VPFFNAGRKWIQQRTVAEAKEPSGMGWAVRKTLSEKKGSSERLYCATGLTQLQAVKTTVQFSAVGSFGELFIVPKGKS
jgi:hypothetical protein